MFGDAPTIASNIMAMEELREAIFTHFIQTLSNECSGLCGVTEGSSLFRRISVTALASNSWEAFICELESKAPTLLHTLFTLVSVNDGRKMRRKLVLLTSLQQ